MSYNKPYWNSRNASQVAVNGVAPIVHMQTYHNVLSLFAKMPLKRLCAITRVEIGQLYWLRQGGTIIDTACSVSVPILPALWSPRQQ